MDKELFFENKRYISSREAAALAGFTHDYISKLCRYGKIAGRKVGHTWYVEERSFQEYLLQAAQNKQERVEVLSEQRRTEYQSVVSSAPSERAPAFFVKKAPEKTFAAGKKLDVSAQRFSFTIPIPSKKAVAAGVLAILLLINIFTGGAFGVFAKDGFVAESFEKVATASADLAHAILGGSAKTGTAQVAAAPGFIQTAVTAVSRLASGVGRFFSGVFAFLGGGEDATSLSDLGSPEPDTAATTAVAPASSGSTTTISFIPGLSGAPQAFSINTSVRIQNGLTIGGATTVGGGLTVNGTGVFAGELQANGGIVTGGANVNLGQGQIFASNIINQIQAGSRVTITGPANAPIISARGGGGGSVSSSGATEFTSLSDAPSTILSNAILHGNAGGTALTQTAGFTFNGTTLTVSALNLTGSATTTLANGINVTSGCFSVNGTCVSGGSGSGTVNAGIQGQIAYYDSAAATVSGTSTIFITTAGNVGVGTTSPFATFSVGGQVAADYFTSTLTSGVNRLAGGLNVGNGGLVYDSSTGRVGVATTSPSTGLAVGGNIYTTGGIGVGSVRTTPGITIANIASCAGSTALQTDSSGGIVCGAIASLGISTAGGWSTDSVGHVTLATTTDRVGIGATTTPYAKLSVINQAAATTTLALVPFTGQSANIIDIYNGTGNLTSVFTANHFLGLGTTSPYAQLSVAGSAHVGGTLTTGGLIATGTIVVQGTGTSTFTGNIDAAGDIEADQFFASGSGTSTFVGLTASGLSVTGSATSSFANGVQLLAGCFRMANGVCIAGGSGGFGTVTSVDVSGGTTGLSFTGGPVTTAGTITMAGTLSIANGGTNASSFSSGLVWFDGTRLAATSSQVTVGSLLATTTATSTFNGGIATTRFNATATSTLAGLVVATGGAQISTLASCNTIDTDASGNLICGTDDNGLGTIAQSKWATSTGDANAIYAASATKVGIGTSSPYAALSVNGEVVARNFTATGTVASTFPYASSTALTVSGSLYVGALTGVLQAVNGLVSSTSTISTAFGGTGTTSPSGLLVGTGSAIVSSSTLSTAFGGTGLSTAPSYGQILVGNSTGGYTLTATSSLGLPTSAINSLGAAGQLQTGSTQTFATGTPDTNLALTITSSANTHTFTMGWLGTLSVARGGTGSSTPSNFLFGDGAGNLVSTSTIAQNYIDGALLRDAEIDTSSELAALLTDETGSGAVVFGTLPTLGGFISTASSTIIGGFTVSGNSTTTGLIIVQGTGTSTFAGNVDVAGNLEVASLMATATSTLAGLRVTTGGAQISTLASCNTIDTDASGNLICGTDDTGADATNSKWATSTSDTSAIYNVGLGAVGVGTSTPRWQLTVASSSAPQLALSDMNAGTDLKHWTLRSAGGNLYFATSSDSFSTSTVAALVIDRNGRVGVGTSSPGTLFSIGNAANFTDNAVNITAATSTLYGGGVVRGQLGIGDTPGTNKLFVTGTNLSGSLGSFSSIFIPSASSTYSSDAVALNQTISAATVNLTVSGNLLEVFRTSSVSSGRTALISGAMARFDDNCSGSGTCISSGDVVQIIQETVANTGSALNITSGSTQNSAYVLRVNDDGNFTDGSPFVVDVSGNVGVGTTSPYAKLSVVGEVVAANFTGTSTATSTLGGGLALTRLDASATSTLDGLIVETGGLRLSNLNCSVLSNGGTLTTDTAGNVICSVDDGGSGAAATWSTTTSQVAGQFINYPNNTSDIVVIGGTATTSTEFYFDPNTNYAYLSSGDLILDGTNALLGNDVNLGIGTTSPFTALSVSGNAYITGSTTVGNLTATGTLTVQGSGTSTFSGGLTIGGGARVSTLLSCDTIDTDASGNLICGSDNIGAGVLALSKWATSTGDTSAIYTAGATKVGIGTSSPYAALSVVGEVVAANFTGTSTATSTLAGGLQTSLLNVTSTSATSTFAAGLSSVGFLTSSGLTISGGKLSITSGATSTANNGINLSAGCFAVNGVCIAAGVGGFGTVTSVDVSGGTTGLSFTGGPVTTSGTITMSGTLSIANGGTNAAGFQTGLVWFDGTRLAATSSQVTVGSIIATTTATSTFGGGIAATRLNTSATSTLSGLVVASGGAQVSTLLSCNTIDTDASGNLICGSDADTDTVNSKWATSTSDLNAIYNVGLGAVGIGTTTPKWQLTVASSSAPQLALSDMNAGVDLKHWTLRSAGGSLYFATSTDKFATSSVAALTIDANGRVGVGTSSPGSSFSIGGIANFTAATSTFYGGLSASGLLSSNGLVVSGGSLKVTSAATSTFAGDISVAGMSTLSSNVGIGTSANSNVTLNVIKSSLGITTSSSFDLEQHSLTVGSAASTTYSGSVAEYALSSSPINANITFSGSVFDFARSVFPLSSRIANITGTLAVFTDTCQASGGTCVSTNDVMRLGQATSVNTGTVLNISSSSTQPGALLVRVNDDNGYADASPFVIDVDGNVGIGTTTPYAKLSVVGEVVASYFTGTTTATSTFGGGLLATRLNTSATSTLAGLNVETGGLRVSTLVSCDTIDTDASGNFICGSDNAGSGTDTVNSKWATSTSDLNAIFNVGLGAVGIGTSTPKWQLTVASSSAPQLALSDMNAGVDLKHWTLRSAGGSLYFATSTDKFATSSVAALIINQNGLIGIGTSSPAEQLSVAGRLFVGGTGTSTFENNLEVRGTLKVGTGSTYLTSNNLNFSSAGTITGASTLALQPAAGSNLNVTLSGAGDFAVNTNQLYVDTSAGFVGVGTSSPATTLSVAGNTYVTGALGVGFASPSAELHVHEPDVADLVVLALTTAGTGSTASDGFQIGYDDNTSSAFLTNSENTSLVIKTNNTEAARLTASGNFGLGTTSPFAKLSVVGSTVLDSNLIIFGSSSASTLTLNYAAKATSTIANGQLYAWTLATSTTATPIISIDTLSTTGKATTSINGGLVLDGGAFSYDSGSGITSIDNIQLGMLSFEDNAGLVGWVDLPVSTTTKNLTMSYSAMMDGDPLLTLYGVTAGNGGVNNPLVAIGTSTPYAKLSVWSGTTTSQSAFEVANGASTTLLTVLSSGNVGVGTTSPTQALSVQGGALISGTTTIGNLSATGTLAIAGTGTSTFTGGISISGGVRATNLTSCNTVDTDASGNFICGTDETSAVALQQSKWATSTGDANAIYTAGATKVGIGTTTPYAALAVSGEVVASHFSATTTATSSFLGAVAIGSTTPHTQALFDVGTSSSLFTINKLTGRVGVGTTSPSAQLAVQGLSVSAAGASAPFAFYAQGGIGGAGLTGSSGGNAGSGGLISLISGDGGLGGIATAAAGGVGGVGGAAGGLRFTTGAGGTGGARTSGSGVGVGGNGGDGGTLTITAGPGGSGGSNAGSGSGGDAGLGGGIVFTTGRGGFGGVGGGGSGFGNNGGSFTFLTGNGGGGAAAGGGGNFSFTAGNAGTTTGSGGTGGSFTFTGGDASAGLSEGASGGSFTFTGGTGSTTGNGGNFTVNAGAGGTSGLSGNILLGTIRGLVGIGTTTPTQSLSVQGGALISGTTTIGNLSATGTLAVAGTGTSTFTGGVTVSGGLRASTLISCDTIDTDASGNLICGTDANSGGTATANSKWATSTSDLNAIYNVGLGAVGIGTSTPKWQLTVASSSAPQLALSDMNAGVDLKHWTLRSAGGSLYFATSTDKFATSSVAALTIDANGRVGVGTTSPTLGKVVVAGGRGSFLGFATGMVISTANGDENALGFYNERAQSGWTNWVGNFGGFHIGNATDFYAVTVSTTTGNQGILGVSDETPDAALEVSASGATIPLFMLSSVDANDGDRFIVSNTGSVGIGTTSPFARLSVVGNTVLDSNLIIFGSSTASSLVLDYRAKATSTIANGIFNSFVIATSTTADPIFSIDTQSTTGKATTTINGGLSINGGAIFYDAGANVTSIERLNLGAVSFDTDAGVLSWIDMPVSSSAPANTVMSYSAQLDNTSVLTIWGMADGAGSVRNARVGIGTTTPVSLLTIQASSATTSKEVITVLNSASTTLFAVSDTGSTTISGPLTVGTSTATTTIRGFLDVLGTGTNATSTFSGNLWVKGTLQTGTGSVFLTDTGLTASNGQFNLKTSGTSTFAGGIQVQSISIAGGSATSSIDNGLAVTGGFRVSGLVSCNTIDTDASGNFTCGSDEVGGGGGASSSKWATSSSDLNAIYNVGLGAVGIGTTTPKWQLSVASSSAPQFALTDPNAGTNLKHWTLRNAGGNFYVATSSDLFATSSDPAFTIGSNGRVGIGTSTPGAYLSVQGLNGQAGGHAPAGLLVQGGNGSGSGNGGGVNLLGGLSGTTGGKGGAIFLKAGNEAGGSGLGASLTLTGGDQAGLGGGDVSINGGQAHANSSDPGNITITGGSIQNATAGAVSVTGGASTNGSGGNLTLAGGSGGSVGGDVYVLGGSATTQGDVLLAVTSAGVARGKVGIGTTSPYAKLSVVGEVVAANLTATSTAATSTLQGTLLAANGGAVGVGTSTPWRTFSVQGSVAMSGLTSSATGNALCITTGGELTDAGGGTCTPSSQRFKENIQTLAEGNALDILGQLNVVSFDYKEGYFSPEDGKSSYGLIAEEVAGIDPRLVDYGYDGNPLTLHFERLTGLTIQAVQELNARTRFIENAAGTTTLSVDASGNVGIGTLTPSAKLTVSGEVLAQYFTSTSTLASTFGGAINVNATNSTSTIAGNLVVLGTLDANVVSAGDLTFANGFRLTEKQPVAPTMPHALLLKNQFGSTTMSIDEDGNVAIGTTTTGYKVAVGGDIAATGFINVSTAESKTDIEHLDEEATADILQTITDEIKVAQYRYKSEDENNPLRLGLIAEEAPAEVLSVAGDGVDIYKLSTFTLAGLQELAKEFRTLELRVTALEALSTSTAAVQTDGAGIIAMIFEALRSVGVKFVDGVVNMAAVVAQNLTIGTKENPTGFTIYDEVTGEPYCVKMKDGVLAPTLGECALVGDATLPADSTTPFLKLLGDSPLYLNEGDSYDDAGVATTSLAVGTTTMQYFVNNKEVDEVELATIEVATYRISYVITGEAGYQGTTTRTVVVREKKDIEEKDNQPVLIDTGTSTPSADTSTSTESSSGGASSEGAESPAPSEEGASPEESTDGAESGASTDVGTSSGSETSAEGSGIGSASSAGSDGSSEGGGASSSSGSSSGGDSSSSSSGSESSASSSGSDSGGGSGSGE